MPTYLYFERLNEILTPKNLSMLNNNTCKFNFYLRLDKNEFKEYIVDIC